MADDLVVQVSTLLEADVDASVGRIRGQISEIASRLQGANNRIRLEVEINDSNARSTANNFVNRVQQSLRGHRFEMPVGINTASIREVQASLANLRMPDNLIANFSEQLYGAEIEVRKIGATWRETTNDGQALQRTIVEGVDAQQRQVRILATLNQETGELDTKVLSVSKDYEKAAAAIRQQNEAKIAATQKQLDRLEKYQANAMGNGTGEKVQDQAHLDALSEKYKEIQTEIERLRSTDGEYTASAKANVDSLIAEYGRLVTEFQKAEHTATALRSKDVSSQKIVAGEDLNKLEAQLKNSGILTEDFKNKISTLRDELNKVGDSEGLTTFMNHFDELKAEIGSFKVGEVWKQQVAEMNSAMETMPTSIRAVESQIQNLSNPTDTLKANLAEVKTLMDSWGKTTSDEEKIQIYSQLQERLGACKTELSALNKIQINGLRTEKLTSGLEKAKADLETVRRQWSAFARDDGLVAKFNQLSNGLAKVKNQADFSKWQAQFSAFKSEVKAAGLNVQSFGDIIKNNVAKVGQWLGATSIIFRTISTIRNAISTVVAMDTAMIDLRKTTNATEAEYSQFYQSANDTAKALGATTEAVISQTAEWSRLGLVI